MHVIKSPVFQQQPSVQPTVRPHISSAGVSQWRAAILQPCQANIKQAAVGGLYRQKSPAAAVCSNERLGTEGMQYEKHMLREDGFKKGGVERD